MSFLYFAYGSNMLKQRMHINCPSALFKCIGELKNFKLSSTDFAHSWKGAVATILECKNDSVWGVVWEISKEHEEKLDLLVFAVAAQIGHGIKNAEQKKKFFIQWLWGYLKSKVYQGVVQDLAKLKDNISRTVLEIPADILLSAVVNTVHRMQYVVHKYGNHIGHDLNVQNKRYRI
ncbi:Gamma-glutamylcyclotransferase like protein [Argiope bruennichi]|uniref:gamma-glutamylcyclotransferase n=1 Tax=Argiope bruennichi TaxID=94029 RepID=A0A8T0EUE0_ARGBR|nr:Gamma-glutamylcyclotransferase like protein [Argiope bruennichi]